MSTVLKTRTDRFMQKAYKDLAFSEYEVLVKRNHETLFSMSQVVSLLNHNCKVFTVRQWWWAVILAWELAANSSWDKVELKVTPNDGQIQSRLGFKSRFDQCGDLIWSLKIRFDTNMIQFSNWFENFALNPSVLWHCCLGSRKGIWPVKNWVVGYWRGYVSGLRCTFAYGPDDATATHYFLLQ